MGLQESEGSITVKINRGAFPAWFLIAAMEAGGGDKSKARLIWTSVIALAFVIAFTAWGLWFQSGYHQQAADQSAQYERWAKNEVEKGCPTFTGVLTRTQCFHQAHQAAHENKRDEYDLYAQRTSALWAGIMAVAALLGIGLSAVGVWLVRETFIATVATNKITQNQLDDARQMARPIIDISVKLATTPESVQPYDHYLPMNIGITNRGNTEARDVSIVNATIKLTKRSKAISFYDTALAKGRDIYGNGGSATVELAPRERVFLKDIIFAKGKTAIIALEYSYHDSFGNKVTLSDRLEGTWVMEGGFATCDAAQKIPKN